MQLDSGAVERLRYAIVRQAVSDYYRSKCYLLSDENDREYRYAKSFITKLKEKKNKEKKPLSKAENERKKKADYCIQKHRNADLTLYECKEFFRSGWFGELCHLDAEEILSMLDKRAEMKDFNAHSLWKDGEE